jgi:hypothetical protein
MHFEQLRAEAKPVTALKEIAGDSNQVMQAIAKLQPCKDKDAFPEFRLERRRL